MIYSEVIDYMYSQLPMFHRIGKAAFKSGLDNALHLDSYFKFPHRNYKTIHVAGTNGKGSVSHSVAAILQSAGYKTGLFTSPHLKDFRERIRVNGEMIPETEVVDFIENHQKVFDEIKPSFFEMTSALAFYYFEKEKVDVAIIEVGMGGRLDSTNIITPELSVITNIGFDHTEFLGDTLAKIAAEKAGIIKPGVPVVIGEYHPETWPVFEQIASQNRADITVADKSLRADYSLFSADEKQIFTIYQGESPVYKRLVFDLSGFYQRKNILTILAVVEQLRNLGFSINNESMYSALANVSALTGLKGRWQTLGHNPLIICDTGHNVDGITWITQQIKAVPYKKLHIVMGVVSDKDVTSILGLLPKEATYYFSKANIPRALDALKLKEKARTFDLYGESYTSVSEALIAAQTNAAKEDFIFVGGSTFVVAEVI
ncbi:MAG: folylpolyglutamate synthase/dihydrofolate synthase family protein [Bacteroidota bacterium]|nr:folylpolyglutamate synthase/dihydrofolate synthase family protein [Bacteroidota bacterium]